MRCWASSDAKARFSYAAQFTCGLDPAGKFARIVPGQYATAVNVHNPSGRDVVVRQRLALTFPDAQFGSAREPGLVSDWLTSDVGQGEAIEIDCGEVPSEFFPGDVFPPYIQGFLVIESASPRDVTAVYTAASVDETGEMEVRSIDVESVPERRLGKAGD